MNYWTKQDGQFNKVVYQSSFEGGDEAMFYPNPDGEYNRSTAQASSGTYSLYLNAHTHNGNHYGPNIMHSFVETGDKLLIDFKAYFEADNSTWNNDEGGRMVYELLDEQGGYLYTTTGTRQWRAVHINGDAQTWRSYSVNFTIPQTYKADGTPYNGKIKIKTNAWVNILHNPTYFDEFKMLKRNFCLKSLWA